MGAWSSQYPVQVLGADQRDCGQPRRPRLVRGLGGIGKGSMIAAALTSPCLIRSDGRTITRSEEHTSELQSLMRISYAVFCLKKKKTLCLSPRTPLNTSHLTHAAHTHTPQSINQKSDTYTSYTSNETILQQ